MRASTWNFAEARGPFGRKGHSTKLLQGCRCCGGAQRDKEPFFWEETLRIFGRNVPRKRLPSSQLICLLFPLFPPQPQQAE